MTLALGLAAGAPAPNQAPTVDGRVRDDVGGTPVAGTLVVLMDTAGNEFMRTESDAAGAFRFRVPAAGRYMLYAQRMGYAPLLSRPLEVRKDTLGVELRMIPDPVPLEPVRVTTEARRIALTDVGFYQRKKLGIGRFITEEQIESRRPTRTSEILAMEPSVRRLFDYGGDGGTGTAIVFRGTLRGLREGTGLPCLPTLVLDGMRVRKSGPVDTTRARTVRLDELISPSDISAIELYPSGAGAPARWSGMDAGCGVIMVWTKRRRP